MQQDTLNSSNRIKYIITITLFLLVTNISSKESVDIYSLITDKMIPSTHLTVTTERAEILSSTTASTEMTVLDTTTEMETWTTDEITSWTTSQHENSTSEDYSSVATDIENTMTTETANISTVATTQFTKKIIKSENLKMNMCALVNDCIHCVKSNDSCTWSINENACIAPDAPLRNSTNDIMVQNDNFPGEVQRKGPSFCPRIATRKNITVPSDTHKMIKIEVSLKNFVTTHPQFTCRFGDGPEAIVTSATLLMNAIHCSNAYFSYPGDEPFVQLPVSVLNSGNALSNPKDIKLIVYKCRYVADSCISCFSLGRSYECGWCPGSATCEISGHCEETTIENLWIGRRGLCPQFTQ